MHLNQFEPSSVSYFLFGGLLALALAITRHYSRREPDHHCHV